MVCGHTSLPAIASNYIFSFHMPLFFIVSGMLFNAQRHHAFVPFLKRRLRTLGLPYLAFSVISICINATYEQVDVADIIANGWGGFALWFIPVLFLSELLMHPVICRVQHVRGGTGWMVGLLLVLLVGGYTLMTCNIHLPYKLDVVPWASFFYGMGFLLRKFLRHAEGSWWTCIGLWGLSFALSAILPRLSMGANQYGTLIPNNVNALLGTIAVILWAKRIEKSGWLWPLRAFFRWAGANTLVIVGLSQCVNLALKDSVIFHLLSSEAANSLLRHALLWVILFGASLLLNRFVPWAVGKARA